MAVVAAGSFREPVVEREFPQVGSLATSLVGVHKGREVGKEVADEVVDVLW
jgi:hypothetical protein